MFGKLPTGHLHAKSSLYKQRCERDNVNTDVMFWNIHDNLQ